MLKILLATGNENLDQSLIKKYAGDSKIEINVQPVYYREGLSDSIVRVNADIVLLSDFLDGGSLTQIQLIKIIRKKHPKVRIVYILKDEDNVEMKKFLFTLGVYDVIAIYPKLNTMELYRLITEGNQWEDVSQFFSDFDPSDNFQINEDFILSRDKNLEYYSFGVKLKKKPEDLINNFNAFWSPRAQSGSTTLLSNAAIMLAQKEEERILLVDFNISNPNLHLSLGADDYDGNHNLSALCEDIAEGTFHKAANLNNYLLYHSTYKNVFILPGLILKYDNPSDDILIRAFEYIFEFAKRESFTSIMFDMDNDLSAAYNIELLKRVSKVIMPLTERPGTIVNLQKVFDAEFGLFFFNYLDINKIHPVMNFTSNTIETKKIAQIIENVLKRNIYAEIPYLKEIAISNNDGAPYLRQKPEGNIFREFVKLTNCVHDIFVVPPVNESKKNLFNRKK